VYFSGGVVVDVRLQVSGSNHVDHERKQIRRPCFLSWSPPPQLTARHAFSHCVCSTSVKPIFHLARHASTRHETVGVSNASRRAFRQARHSRKCPPPLRLTTSKVMVIVWRLKGNIIRTVLYIANVLPLQWKRLTKTAHTARLGLDVFFRLHDLSLCWCMFCFTLVS